VGGAGDGTTAGGGGGGYYGGGGGAWYGGGGGGSSFTSGLVTTNTRGVRTGHGRVAIVYEVRRPPSTPPGPIAAGAGIHGVRALSPRPAVSAAAAAAAAGADSDTVPDAAATTSDPATEEAELLKNLVNLSLHRPCRQSSQHTQFKPEHAVDGNRDDPFSHTNPSVAGPIWWEVDVGPSLVVLVDIYNRGKCQRLRDITLSFYLDDDEVAASPLLNEGNCLDSPLKLSYQLPQPLQCNRVRVTRTPDDGNTRQLPQFKSHDPYPQAQARVLSMCQVEVLGVSLINDS